MRRFAALALALVGGCSTCHERRHHQPASSSPIVDPPGASVLEFHKSPTREGVFEDRAMTLAAARAVHRDASFSPQLEGQIYAQPLWVEDGPDGHEAFVVATEKNHVTAIDAKGAIVWDHAYGAPASAGLPCGNIAVRGATLGITGTPVVDPASRTVYFDAMTDVGGQTNRHRIHAVSLDDGSERAGWPVDVSSAVPGFDSPHQNQRGALLLVSGVLYVPYGGHFGDCLPYYGWVVGVNAKNPRDVRAWRAAGPPTWSTKPPVGAAGIWASGGLSSDGRFLYATTGNSMNGGFRAPRSWVGGNAVLKLGLGPVFSNRESDEFHPSNWEAMDDHDTDLGGSNAVLFDMPGARFPHLAAALGKDGKLYLLDRGDLGGRGGALSATRVAKGAITGGAAVYTTPRGTYLAFRTTGTPVDCDKGGNLGVAKIAPGDPPTAHVVWCSKASDLGSPIATTTDGKSSFVVWDAGKCLYGFDGDTGAVVYDGCAAPADALPDAMHYFNAPIVAKGRVVVATCGHCPGGNGSGSLVVYR
jgi:hypothetical protein